MSVGLGFRGHLGLGEESSYGSVVSRTHFVEFNSESITLEEDKLETAGIYRRGIQNTKVAQGPKRVTGDIEFDATYGGWLKLAKHALGRIDTSTPDPTSAPTVKLHKFTIQDSLPTGLSLEVFRDTTDFVTEASKAHVYTGCKINSIGFSAAVDEILKVQMGIMGQDESRATKTTPNFAQEKLAVYHQGNLLWGSDALPIENFSLQVANGLGARPKFNSRVTREPLPESHIEVSGSFSIEFDTWSQYDDFKAATERAIDVTFTGDVITGSFSKYIRLLCNVGQIRAVRNPLSNPGRVKLEIDFKAMRSLLYNELELYVQNTETGV